MDTNLSRISSLCRACTGKVGKDGFDLVACITVDGDSLFEKFKSCSSLQVLVDDGLPMVLCGLCSSLLEQFYQFKLMCAESETKLKNIKVDLANCENTIGFSIKTECNDACEDETFEQEQKTPTLHQVKQDADNQHTKADNLSDFLLVPPAFDSEESDIVATLESDGMSNDECESYREETDEDIKPTKNLPKEKKSPKKEKLPKSIIACSECGKNFSKQRNLEAHLRIHKGLKACSCPTCGKEFNSVRNLDRHIKRSHNALPTEVPCEFDGCGKIFRSKEVMRQHKRRIHLKIYQTPESFVCELCGKTFAQKPSLSKHYLTHTGERPFECDICPKKYTTKYKLEVHLKMHKGIKDYVCATCGLRKTTQHDLNVHIRVHTKEKAQKCEFCQNIYSNPDNLRRHIDIVHKQIKPFGCQFCDRAFGKAEHLKHHTMTHTGEKPHQCKICLKRFIQPISLKKHMSTHNGASSRGRKRSSGQASLSVNEDVMDNIQENCTLNNVNISLNNQENGRVIVTGNTSNQAYT